MRKGNKRDEFCTLPIGSMTQAMQAQRALEQEGIFVHVQKTDTEIEERGCAYAVGFPCGYESEVKRILKSRELLPTRGRRSV